MNEIGPRVEGAVRFFWEVRSGQRKRQGAATGDRDHGNRSAVTGGKQLDGFTFLIRDLLIEGGVPEQYIITQKPGTRVELPGYFRPEKKWDLFVVAKDRLLAVVELKSHIGPSFGNNYNNRTEEAIGNATDIWHAYKEGAFPLDTRPWLGYLMLLEDTEKSNSSVKVQEPYFGVFEEFRGASYAQRYKETITRLLRERLYDGGCFIMSPNEKAGGLEGKYHHPSAEFTFERFTTAMLARVAANLKTI